MSNPVTLVTLELYRGGTLKGTFTVTDPPASISAPRLSIRADERGPVIFDSDADDGADVTVSGSLVNLVLYGTTSANWQQEELFYEVFVNDDADDRQYTIAHGPLIVYPSEN